MVELLQHQKDAMERLKDFDHVAFFHDMGLGKTFEGAEKMRQFGEPLNLIVCQKSKIEDWKKHLTDYYDYDILNLQTTKDLKRFQESDYETPAVFIINYESVWREKCKKLNDLRFTLLLDESSIIQNSKAKVTKYLIKLFNSNNIAHTILLSGTPVSGKYENYWSQSYLLGWDISKRLFDKHYVIKESRQDRFGNYFTTVIGYKNVDRLKQKLTQYGADFIKTEEVIDLPTTNVNIVTYKAGTQYKKFKKDKLLITKEKEYVGDSTLSYRLYQRMLLAQYKKNVLTDLLASTNDRVIVFYEYNIEREVIEQVVQKLDKPISYVNGDIKDLSNFNTQDNTVLIVNYKAGAKGGNYQLANKMILFSPTESAENYSQAKKRIHRVGQQRPCFYWELVGEKTIEEDIYEAVRKGVDYNDYMFLKKGEI